MINKSDGIIGDDVELLRIYPTVIYHTIMQGNGNNCNIIFDENVLNQHTLINSDDDEEKNKYPTVKFGESCGKVLLHTDPRFNSMFQEITGHVKLYLSGIFSIKVDIFDIYVIKSWYNIFDYGDNIGYRDRKCSDISFVYYPKLTESFPSLWVSNAGGQINSVNEIFPNVFSQNRKGKKFIRDYNQLNIPQQAIYPSEGSIVIYPSNIPTGFFNAESSKESTHIIQGEIKLTLKPDILSTEDGLISINHWKKFNS